MRLGTNTNVFDLEYLKKAVSKKRQLSLNILIKFVCHSNVLFLFI